MPPRGPENEAENPSSRSIFRPLEHSLRGDSLGDSPGGSPVLRRDGPEPQAEQREKLHPVFGGKGGTDRPGNRRSVFAFHFVSELDECEALFAEIGEDLIEETFRVEDEPVQVSPNVVGLGRLRRKSRCSTGVSWRKATETGAEFSPDARAMEFQDFFPKAVRQCFPGQLQQVSKRRNTKLFQTGEGFLRQSETDERAP